MKQTIPESEMHVIAKDILKILSSKKTQGARVCALSGDLGSGKTTLAQNIARELGVVERIISPTFVIMKLYPLTNNKYGFKKLVHIDSYRLQSSKELFNLGWEDIISDPSVCVLVEWPEYVPECIPPDALRVTLSHSKEDSRHVFIEK